MDGAGSLGYVVLYLRKTWKNMWEVFVCPVFGNQEISYKLLLFSLQMYRGDEGMLRRKRESFPTCAVAHLG